MSLTLAAFTSGSVTGFAGGSGLLEIPSCFCSWNRSDRRATTTGSGVGPYTASLTTPDGTWKNNHQLHNKWC